MKNNSILTNLINDRSLFAPKFNKKTLNFYEKKDSNEIKCMYYFSRICEFVKIYPIKTGLFEISP